MSKELIQPRSTTTSGIADSPDSLDYALCHGLETKLHGALAHLGPKPPFTFHCRRQTRGYNRTMPSEWHYWGGNATTDPRPSISGLSHTMPRCTSSDPKQRKITPRRTGYIRDLAISAQTEPVIISVLH